MRLLAGLALSVFLAFGADELSKRRAPGFSLPDIKFNRYDLQDYRGKWVLLDFIRTDCPHCSKMSKALEQAKQRYGDKVRVLTVVLAHIDTPDRITKYQQANNITSPILIDQGQMAASYFKASPTNPGFDTPHLFVIDPQGVIVRDFGHGPEMDNLNAQLDPLINRK
ncbi:MAG: peroxiredoxin family protein [Bryobacteraceae bacterium]|nr:peroxiredoxin family protein [Bryobacteraceae bacterium]